MFDKMIIVKLDKGVERGFKLDQVISFYGDAQRSYINLSLSNGRSVEVSNDDVTVNMLYMLLVGAFDKFFSEDKRVYKLEDLFEASVKDWSEEE